MTEREIKYDVFYDEWFCELGGPGNPKIVANDKTKLEDFLDYLENRNRTARTGDDSLSLPHITTAQRSARDC